jgi:hypothetical protein
MGIGWRGRAGRNKFEFAKDLMERDSEENSGRGMGMTFCQRRKGTRRVRGSGGICDWRQGKRDL